MAAPAVHPAEMVDTYLQLCEDRELEAASRYLSPDVRLEFPGGEVFGSLAELVAASGGKYRWVRKRRTRFAVGEIDGQTTVTSIGTLYGEALDGSPFEGIRYVDFFVVGADGLIREQLVWNDLVITGVVAVPGRATPA
jgi:hypothetical protein